MATVVAVHRGTSVTVRFDDGSDARVSLSPGDAEICADDALAPTIESSTGPPTPTVSRSRRHGGSGGGSSSTRSLRPKPRRSAKKIVRTLGPGGRVLREGEGTALTEERARALLDTAPHKLVGLAYQEHHRGYGGWWDTTVTGISSECIGNDSNGSNGGKGKNKDAVNKRWPESVNVGQMDRSVDENKDETAAGKDDEGDADEPDFVYTRKISGFLSRLRIWDKHREAEWQATLQEEGEEEEEERVAVQADKAKVGRFVLGTFSQLFHVTIHTHTHIEGAPPRGYVLLLW